MLVLRRKLNDPVFLLALVAALGAFVVQSGELGSSDTTHRLQVAYSFWTSEPPVFPQEYPEFGLHGRGGKLQSWYGMGQSLLLLPADIIGTYIERLPIFARYNGNDPAVRNIVVTYITNILVNVLTALIALRFLRQLGFSIKQSVAGVLALLFCTTHLHYTQNLMENNYIMLLTLVGFSFQFEWLSTGSRRALLIGSAALGLNLLTRLTTGLDLLASGVLLLLGYIAFYAKYTVWSGDFAWGDRYVSTAAELAAFISVPLLLRYRVQLRKPIWILGIILIVISACIQIASLAFWLPLEIYQMETRGHPTFVIALRFKNIVAFALGKMDQWGLTNHAMMEDDWDYVHITTWNFLPFLLRRVGEAPAWVVRITFIVWGISIAAFAGTMWRLRRLLQRQI